MPAQTLVDNKFIGGLKTEFTGLNFPPDSCTETFDCVFSRTGLVTRRLGFDYESSYALETLNRGGQAMNTYYWKNVIGDSTVSLLVLQIGTTLYFYRSTDATLLNPLSHQKLASTVSLSSFLASGASSVDATVECQFSDGNGYLFVYHKDIDPIAISYSAGTLTGAAINVKIRDFEGVTETGVEDTFRPNTLSANHEYNLKNQGWTNAPAWTATSTTSNNSNIGSHTWTVQSGLTISNGQVVTITGGTGSNFVTESGTVTSYSGTTLVINVTSTSYSGSTFIVWTFAVVLPSNITAWFTAIGNYPSNSDVWWLFKNASDVFDPATTYNNVTLNAGPAPKGFYILDAFNQKRTTASGVATTGDVTTGGVRPTTGAFYAGRVWYTGVNFLKFNENIYFSQIIENITQFGKCYQINDPTSEDRFDLLPSDGGVIKIQGAGRIFKLFPIANGILVFAEKGIWFITGSQGIGFTSNDYTITKISAVSTISATSFTDVMGMPMWWNADSIYSVAMGEQGGLQVNPITVGTIQSFYDDIPLSSKHHVKGYFNPIEYNIQWLYKNDEETSVTTRYNYTNILNLNTVTNAFYPWTISLTGFTYINGLIVIGGTGGSTSPPITFKYLTSTINGSTWDITFSEEWNAAYRDWALEGSNIDYTSYFITGYRLYTQGNKLGQLPYIDIHSAGGGLAAAGTSACDVQAHWDFTLHGNEGRWSSIQQIYFDATNRAYEIKRRRIRGQGKAVQLKFSSVSGSPMSLIGWSTWISANEIP